VVSSSFLYSFKFLFSFFPYIRVLLLLVNIFLVYFLLVTFSLVKFLADITRGIFFYDKLCCFIKKKNLKFCNIYEIKCKFDEI
jgi:hypothetical protein